MPEIKSVIITVPCLDGSFFLSVSAVPGGGAVPYAILSSKLDLRGFLKKQMRLATGAVNEIMLHAENDEAFPYVDEVPDSAVEAIMQNQIQRRQRLCS